MKSILSALFAFAASSIPHASDDELTIEARARQIYACLGPSRRWGDLAIGSTGKR